MTGEPAKILIIEDEALVARELKGRLTALGYNVVGIAYDAGGVELAREVEPDLLLTDIHLKRGEDGIEVAETIRRERDVPVVFLTAYSDDETVRRAKEVTPYGYIVKPVENRELQIAIEMALYKFNIERELRETQQLLQTALTCIGSALVFLDTDGVIQDLNSDAETLFNKTREACRGVPWQTLFQLEPGSHVEPRLRKAFQNQEVVQLPPFVVGGGDSRLVDGIVGPMDHGAVLIIRQLSHLPDPVEVLSDPEALCQLLIHVDHGTGVTDSLMNDVMSRLEPVLRATDLVTRYDEDLIAVSMPYTPSAVGGQIAQAVLTTLADQLPGVRLSVGVANSIQGDQQPIELFRRASRAMQVAREAGGSQVMSWNDSMDSPASGVPQNAYRHVLVLWNVMNVVTGVREPMELAERFCEHLCRAFQFPAVAILQRRNETISALGGARHGGHFEGVGDLGLVQPDYERLVAAFDGGRESHSHGTQYVFALDDHNLLFIEAGELLSADETGFLASLVHYVAGGLARPQDASDNPVEPSAELLFTSPAMLSVMDRVSLVAGTDATVLIQGESGTGKERIARSIHEQSPRAEKPFVIVDCGAVSDTLIESELFGHVKGAFTGADRDYSGRLREAEGGTVLLDEIGELPISVQAKLLRFVQEKTVASLGSTRWEPVDTRVIAATNRDLLMRAREGEFREDLYYRLNVFTVDTPPLRERREDIPVIAEHYLGSFARQYGKRVSGFSADAEQAMREYEWPGNVRELINTVNRAVILCRDSVVGIVHLGLFGTSEASPVAERSLNATELPDPLAKLLEAEVVPGLLRTGRPVPVAPLLQHDVILLALARNEQVVNRAARYLGVPESTLRRRLSRMPPDVERPWNPDMVARLLDLLDRVAGPSSKLDVLDSAMVRVLEQTDLSRTDAAIVMDVSLPTYRKLVTSSQ